MFSIRIKLENSCNIEVIPFVILFKRIFKAKQVILCLHLNMFDLVFCMFVYVCLILKVTQIC